MLSFMKNENCYNRETNEIDRNKDIYGKKYLLVGVYVCMSVSYPIQNLSTVSFIQPAPLTVLSFILYIITLHNARRFLSDFIDFWL